MTNKKQQGFGYIAAIVVVLILSMLGIAAARLYTSQQASASQDLLSSRAWQAARAGTEWGMYQALRNASCAASTTLDLSTVNGFHVTVECASYTFKEGESAVGTPQSKTVYTVTATACNSTVCPDSSKVANLDYTERRRVATTCTLTGTTSSC